MKVEILDRQDALAISSTQVETLVKAFLKWKGVSTDEVILHFVSREEITALHGEIFNDPTPTDC
ncbi:MAG: hypothetical protein KDK60_01460, partial [Chlamydiia bacterium]|nr:hypothetical protein [Chlamydiia bacterium]